MNLIGLVERLAATEDVHLALDPGRCLHSQDKFSECNACFELCPAGAIKPGQPPRLEPEACVGCLGCLPACPVGAYVGGDEVPDLVKCAAALGQRQIELVCGRNPHRSQGPGQAAIQLRSCLAGLGSAAYLLLAAGETEAIAVRVDECATCEWASLADQIREQVARARNLLSVWGREDQVQLTESGRESWQRRPVYGVESPPVSRRAIFSWAREGPPEAEQTPVADGYHPFRERLRTMAAGRALPAPPGPEQSLPPAAGFALIAVSDDCVACSTCARACPTGALQVEQEEGVYWHTFLPHACLACAACVHLCAEEALTLRREVPAGQIFGQTPGESVTVPHQMATIRCARCNAPFVPRAPEQKMCAVCNFRRQNPFGATLPPGVAERLNLPADHPLRKLAEEEKDSR